MAARENFNQESDSRFSRHRLVMDSGIFYHHFTFRGQEESRPFGSLYGFEACGVNLDKKLFEFGSADTFYKFTVPKRRLLALQQDNAHMTGPSPTSPRPGTEFGIIVTGVTKKHIFYFGLCSCQSCERVVNMELMTLVGAFGRLYFRTGLTSETSMKFWPAVTEAYRLGASTKTNRDSVIYYGYVDPEIDIKNLVESIRNSAEQGSQGATLDLQIVEDDSKIIRRPDATKALMQKLLRCDSDFTDFKLLSSEWKSFYCHRCILAAQSSELKEFMLRKEKHGGKGGGQKTRSKLVIPANNVTTSAFLEWMYSKDEAQIYSKFEVASGLLKLGRLYKIQELAATAAKILIVKIDGPDTYWCGIAELYELFQYLRDEERIEIIVLLKKYIMTRIRTTFNSKKNKRAKPSTSHDEYAEGGYDDEGIDRQLFQDIKMAIKNFQFPDQ